MNSTSPPSTATLATDSSGHNTCAFDSSPVRLNSKALFGTRQEIEIEHNATLYRLRITSLGKLILTK